MSESLLQANNQSRVTISLKQITQREWFVYLPADQQELIDLSISLYEREKTLNSNLSDYSFIIFPMSKAYEGFLKLYLFELGLISEKTFEGKRFRIGRALNPDIRQSQRDEFWLFDNVAQYCGHDLARLMWDTWLECRNQVFHYFPHRNQYISFNKVEKYLYMIDESISGAYQCKLNVLPAVKKSNGINSAISPVNIQ